MRLRVEVRASQQNLNWLDLQPNQVTSVMAFMCFQASACTAVQVMDRYM